VSERPRILVLGEAVPPGPLAALRGCALDGDVVREAWENGLDRLRREAFDAVIVDPADRAVLPALVDLLQARRILAAVTDGVALVDGNRRVLWANKAFAAWCDRDPVGRDCLEALGVAPADVPVLCPFRAALDRHPDAEVTARLAIRGHRFLDLHLTSLTDPDGAAPRLVVVARDVTALVTEQRKLDALHGAGRQLAPLSPDQLAEMSAGERIELLKANLRRSIRDLLHYEVMEVRLLDRRSGKLEPLLQEGMTPEAAVRELRPGAEGYGVTGHVAATGVGYLCRDTSADPLYLPGAPGARSSLTVPLIYQDTLIGTMNIESPRPGAFSEDDLRFAEVFGREVAAALHTLDLLSAEKTSAGGQVIEAVSREVDPAVDDILVSAASVLERYIGHDPELGDRLRKILASARSIKQAIRQVGDEFAPERPAAVVGAAPPPSLKGLRVLVADADERVRRSAHALLGRWGCVVETARDAAEALTMARLGAYDAILADIRFPDLSGYETYRRLRECQPRAQVVLMTGYGYDPSHTLVKARQDGLKHVLFKPFRVDQLLAALASPADKDGPASSS
jgi:CheY-like chemotaxis protein/PAS domain-containing protein